MAADHPEWNQDERVALVEAGFRIANERVAAWEERYSTADVERYFCECARTACREQLELTKQHYEAVRRTPKRFIVLPGHEMPDFESVVERHGSHVVVEKPDALLHIVVPTDPREKRDPRAAADKIAQEVAPPPAD